jgi:diamine N-acetyltransferase
MKYKDVRLRALEPEDLELLYNWENNNDYWIISNTVSPFSKYTLKRYIENSHKNIYETGQLRLMIDYVPEKKTIGTIDIFDFDPYHKRAGIGILIANDEYRRKGLATMALTGLIDYCFKTLLVHQLFCSIIENNCESIELFRKLGFTEIGKKKDWIRTSEGYLNEIMFQLIKTEG